MKREGRQRGMVKTHPIVPAPWNPRPSPPSCGELGPAPMAGQFTKVSTKPTNHSNFTSKCGRPMCRECHSSPVSKPKDKAKGAQRPRASSDAVLLDYSVRVPRFSAMIVLEIMDSDDCIDRCYRDDHDEEQNDTRVYESDYEISYPPFVIEEVVQCEAKTNGIDGVDNEDEMSFCDVGLFWQVVDGDED